MSQENVELVRRGYDAWNREDLDAFLSVVHPDAKWRGDGAEDLFIGVRTAYYGHAGVREWWDAVHEPWDYFKSHVQRTFVGGDKVVTVVRFEAKGKQSGAEVELPFLTNVFELKDGLVVEFNNYYSLEEALDAAGLKPERQRSAPGTQAAVSRQTPAPPNPIGQRTVPAAQIGLNRP